jgi:hypothetical protein
MPARPRGERTILKAVAAELKAPQYRLKDIEQGQVKNIKSEILLRYIGFLGLSRWFSQWKKANPRLAEKILSPADTAKPREPAKGSQKTRGEKVRWSLISFCCGMLEFGCV